MDVPFGTLLRQKYRDDLDHVLNISDIGYFNYGSPNREQGWVTGASFVGWLAEYIDILSVPGYVVRETTDPVIAEEWRRRNPIPYTRFIQNDDDFFHRKWQLVATTRYQDHPLYKPLSDAARPYIGMKVSDLPDTLNTNITYETRKPFGELLPGIPNIGVDPVTGQTPVNLFMDGALSLSQTIGGFLGFFFSAGGLALMGGVVLVYLGYKGIMGANQSGSAS